MRSVDDRIVAAAIHGLIAAVVEAEASAAERAMDNVEAKTNAAKQGYPNV